MRIVEVNDGSSLRVGQYNVGMVFVTNVPLDGPNASRVGAVDRKKRF